MKAFLLGVMKIKIFQKITLKLETEFAEEEWERENMNTYIRR